MVRRREGPDGRVRDWLGCQFQWHPTQRTLDPAVGGLAYQPARNARGHDRLPASFPAVCGQVRAVFVDYQIVVSYLQKQGGTRSTQLLEETRSVYELAERHNFLIFARHIRGMYNVVADIASRVGFVVNTEWSMASRMFPGSRTSSHGGQ